MNVNYNSDHDKNIKVCKECIVNLDDSKSKGLTNQHLAVQNNHALCLSAVLKAHDVKINSSDICGLTALHYAVHDGNIECTQILLDAGCGINLCDNKNLTELHYAASKGHSACVELLISRHANVNALSDNNLTALHRAANCAHYDCVVALISAKANINAYAHTNNDYVFTPFNNAFWTGSIDCVKLLLSLGCVIDPEDFIDDMSKTKNNVKTYEQCANLVHRELVRRLVENLTPEVQPMNEEDNL